VGKRVALLGLAFKPNTDDMREASSLVLAARLQADGAKVGAYDPVAEEEARKLIRGIDFSPGPLDCVRDADAVVLVTEWEEFVTLDWNAVAGGPALGEGEPGGVARKQSRKIHDCSVPCAAFSPSEIKLGRDGKALPGRR